MRLMKLAEEKSKKNITQEGTPSKSFYTTCYVLLVL